MKVPMNPVAPIGAAADTLMRIRELVRESLRGKAGIQIVGVGIGQGYADEVGAADLHLDVSGTRVTIRIAIPKESP